MELTVYHEALIFHHRTENVIPDQWRIRDFENGTAD